MTTMTSTVAMPALIDTSLSSTNERNILRRGVGKEIEEITLIDKTQRVFLIPLYLTIEKSMKNYWISTSAGISTHGTGRTSKEAAESYVDMILDYYIELRDSEDLLADHLLVELARLRQLIVEPISI